MRFLRTLLFPVVPIYFMVTWLRNKLYDLGLKKSKAYSFPVICVGNLSTGGTGKTPMVEYLIRLLKEDFTLATLSRGYGRATKGFLMATENTTAQTLGDEPYQFYHKFKEDVVVAVDEQRQHGISQLRELQNKPDLIILDDAFQHRKVKAGINILLTSYHNLYTNDIVLPTGNLREPRKGAKRADIIVVTKCPLGVSEHDKERITKAINPEEYQMVFFSTIDYSEAVFSDSETLMINSLKPFTLVTGIANPKPLLEHLDRNGSEYEHLNYKDHHNFSSADIKVLEQKDVIVTTEKDYMRLKTYNTLKDKLFYLPITTRIEDSDVFDSKVIELVKGCH
ncbi:tetraacyldisaccharide 4'-kinase [Hanstruepera ponticola]|uniref:tetraacyldisaccharide 4'-kinase n=1 Tax=Hanstruepera ponticola TaxID=2042995 RepID=UPI000CF0A540|nr:tetraacyldisaccharide 4'-kinase [Hanstruepera ponticola]